VKRSLNSFKNGSNCNGVFIILIILLPKERI
jgi:hypothetical protein